MTTSEIQRLAGLLHKDPDDEEARSRLLAALLRAHVRPCLPVPVIDATRASGGQLWRDLRFDGDSGACTTCEEVWWHCGEIGGRPAAVRARAPAHDFMGWRDPEAGVMTISIVYPNAGGRDRNVQQL